jgi:hypothetical protein
LQKKKKIKKKGGRQRAQMYKSQKQPKQTELKVIFKIRHLLGTKQTDMINI